MKAADLPTFGQCTAKKDRGEKLTALEQLIHDNEPCSGAEEFRSQVAATLGEPLPQPNWRPWSLRDPAPAPGKYVVLVRSGRHNEWEAICRVVPADNTFQNRFAWSFTSEIVAYLPTPIPEWQP